MIIIRIRNGLLNGLLKCNLYREKGNHKSDLLSNSDSVKEHPFENNGENGLCRANGRRASQSPPKYDLDGGPHLI